jgi:predicted GNAT family acetyltransferase
MTVRNNTQSHRYELEIDGSLAKAWYRQNGNVITFTHTDVPKELSGRGVGTQLARGALDAVRATGQKVVALCPFIAAFLAHHHEYDDLLDEPKKDEANEQDAGGN